MKNGANVGSTNTWLGQVTKISTGSSSDLKANKILILYAKLSGQVITSAKEVVFVVVCLSVCYNFVQKLPNGFAQKLGEGWQ